ncbi:MAG: DUF5317 domain-containing protein [Chloroflexota bacterium]|nr:DUF5317 domain-containing protein [Chloroflexota bacterium]
MLLLYAIPAGIAVGLLGGGRLAALGAVQMRWWPLALSGLVFQLLLFSPPVAAGVGALGPALYVGSTAVVLLALLANLGLRGFRVILAGSLLNLAAILVNGGQMPVSVEALAAVHGVSQLSAAVFTNSTVAGADTALAFLGDIFVLPRPIPFANVFSIGDVLIAVGGAWFLAASMRAPSVRTGHTVRREPAGTPRGAHA